MLVLMMVAFRYHWEAKFMSPSTTPQATTSTTDKATMMSLDVYVDPSFGFAGFLMATASSLVIGHVLVFCHRRSEIHLPDDLNTVAEPLFDHSFCVTGGRKRKLCLRFRRMILLILLLVIILLGFGCTRRSFVFQFGGLAGDALGDGRRSAYSLVSLGSSIRDSVEDPNSAGVVALQAVYYFYALITPFGCLLCLFILLTIPMTTRKQLFLLTMVETTNAWSAVEVFVLTIVAALLQISTFSSFMVGSHCDIINEILNDYFDSTEHCYSVDATVTASSVFLVTGVILNSFLVSLLLRLAHTAMGERIAEEEQGPDVTEEPSRLLSGAIISSSLDGDSKNLVQLLSSWQATAWIFDPENNEQQYDAPPGPPVIQSNGSLSPWRQQRRPSFEEEWKEAAERDPQWKSWKQATSVT